MKIMGKINNLYKKFGTENKAIIELEIDRDGFYEAKKAQDNSLFAFIDFEASKQELSANEEIENLISQLANHYKISYEKMFSNLMEMYGIHTKVFIRKDCTEKFINFMKNKNPKLFLKIVNQDGVLDEIWLFKSFQNYENEEKYAFICNLVKECKENGIECSPVMELYAKMGEKNDK